MQIFIKTQRGNTIVLEAEEEELIISIKLKIKEREGFPIKCQYLIFGRKVLEDYLRLMDYGINDQSTIKQCLKLGDGKNLVEEKIKDGKGNKKYKYIYNIYYIYNRYASAL